MWGTILFVLLLSAYIWISYLIIWIVRKYTKYTNKIFRLLILSLVYALFCGLGIAGSGGDPGFIYQNTNNDR
jgi:hypothetical protein